MIQSQVINDACMLPGRSGFEKQLSTRALAQLRVLTVCLIQALDKCKRQTNFLGNSVVGDVMASTPVTSFVRHSDYSLNGCNTT